MSRNASEEVVAEVDVSEVDEVLVSIAVLVTLSKLEAEEVEVKDELVELMLCAPEVEPTILDVEVNEELVRLDSKPVDEPNASEEVVAEVEVNEVNEVNEVLVSIAVVERDEIVVEVEVKDELEADVSIAVLVPLSKLEVE